MTAIHTHTATQAYPHTHTHTHTHTERERERKREKHKPPVTTSHIAVVSELVRLKMILNLDSCIFCVFLVSVCPFAPHTHTPRHTHNTHTHTKPCHNTNTHNRTDTPHTHPQSIRIHACTRSLTLAPPTNTHMHELARYVCVRAWGRGGEVRMCTCTSATARMSASARVRMFVQRQGGNRGAYRVRCMRLCVGVRVCVRERVCACVCVCVCVCVCAYRHKLSQFFICSFRCF